MAFSDSQMVSRLIFKCFAGGVVAGWWWERRLGGGRVITLSGKVEPRMDADEHGFLRTAAGWVYHLAGEGPWNRSSLFISVHPCQSVVQIPFSDTWCGEAF